MATPPTPGKIYIFTSAPSGGLSDNYDLDGLTEGTDYVVMDIPLRIIENISTKKEAGGDYDFPDAETMIKALGYWADKIAITGLIQDDTPALTLARQGYWSTFVCEEREDDDLFLCICFDTTTYWRFYEPGDSTYRQYCEGAFVDTDLSFKWVNSKDLIIQVTFTWKSNW